MELRRELLLNVGALTLFNIVLALVAVAALTRTSPVVQRVLNENIAATSHAQTMLSVIARNDGEKVDDAARESFDAALDALREGSTGASENALLERLGDERDAALEGDAGAIAKLSSALDDLVTLHLEALTDVKSEVRRLGSAGAWIAVAIAVLALGLSVLTILRVESRVLKPLVTLHRALEAFRAGDRHRRCHDMPAPREIRRVVASVNELVDWRAGLLDDRDATVARDSVNRQAIVELLDELPHPSLLLDAAGDIVAASASALELLASPDGGATRNALRAVASRASPKDARELDDASGAETHSASEALPLPGHELHTRPLGSRDDGEPGAWLCSFRRRGE